jgi:Uma2 family endonuclease
MATVAPSQGWTYERYLELDDDQRYEILDGELVVTPAPGTRHQRVLAKLGARFEQFIAEHALGEVYFAPTDVVFGGREVVQPAILFLRAEQVKQIVQERAVHGSPDRVVEILSPGSLHRDRHRKRALYERVGIPEYWIVDPANRAIEVFSLGASGYELSAFAAQEGGVTSRIVDGFSVTVAEIMPA